MWPFTVSASVAKQRLTGVEEELLTLRRKQRELEQDLASLRGWTSKQVGLIRREIDDLIPDVPDTPDALEQPEDVDGDGESARARVADRARKAGML